MRALESQKITKWARIHTCTIAYTLTMKCDEDSTVQVEVDSTKKNKEVGLVEQREP
jgi:hypothetical protein